VRTVRPIVEIDQEHRIVYCGMLSSQEKASIDDILNVLKDEIPKVEGDLKNKYGNKVTYKYYLGKFLDVLLNKYKISTSERRLFWDEIKILASKESRKRNEGKNSKKRSFYEQCFILAQLDLEAVEKLSWRQWQDLLDRTVSREDPRIFDWIRCFIEKVRQDDWREFLKALNMYLKNKDTSVFTNEELFAIYDTLILMSMKWRILFAEFKKDYPKSAKIKNKSAWSKKYYAKCFEMKKGNKRLIDDVLCNEVFYKLMVPNLRG